jgi:hypothetical protein
MVSGVIACRYVSRLASSIASGRSDQVSKAWFKTIAGSAASSSSGNGAGWASSNQGQ